MSAIRDGKYRAAARSPTVGKRHGPWRAYGAATHDAQLLALFLPDVWLERRVDAQTAEVVSDFDPRANWPEELRAVRP